MDHKQQAQMLLFASLVTAALTYTLAMLWSNTSTGLNALSSFIVLALLSVAAGFPGLVIKSIRRIPHIGAITLFATVEAFAFTYLLTVLAILLLGWWVVFPLKAVLVVLMYFAGDALFNRVNGQFRGKVIAAISIVVLTLVLAEGTRILLGKIMAG